MYKRHPNTFRHSCTKRKRVLAKATFKHLLDALGASYSRLCLGAGRCSLANATYLRQVELWEVWADPPDNSSIHAKTSLFPRRYSSIFSKWFLTHGPYWNIAELPEGQPVPEVDMEFSAAVRNILAHLLNDTRLWAANKKRGSSSLGGLTVPIQQ